MAALNYAERYQRALDQAFPYVLNFGALRTTSNNRIFRWVDAQTIKVPTISVTGRVNANRDTIETAQRRYNNDWTPLTLKNHRKWSTLVHPLDISETNMTTTIQNITRVFNEEEKFPEMDAYLISKLHAEYIDAGGTVDQGALTTANVLEKFDAMNLKATQARTPANGRLLYCTPEAAKTIRNAQGLQRTLDLKDNTRRWTTAVEGIDLVDIIEVPAELMMTLYNFTEGWTPGAGARQINMMLVHPSCVITPTQYQFSQLDPPSAGSEGKWVYFEESYEDVFILKHKIGGIQFQVAPA
ncbi:MAG: capsid protein [Oscillospiraceae bacterium]|nr:capsid protein [Oscillospiraceae bacterium]